MEWALKSCLTASPLFYKLLAPPFMNSPSLLCALTVYSALHGFWLVQGLAELANGPSGCGEVVKGGCLFAWNLV
jgi:hypothetical protein